MKCGFYLSLLLTFLITLITACGSDDGSPTSPSSVSAAQTQTDSSLSAPTLQSPIAGEQVSNLQPELIIRNASGGTGKRAYTFELSIDSAFTQITLTGTGIAEGIVTTMWQATKPLQAGTEYFWRVRASTSSGVGPYSSTLSFMVPAGFLGTMGAEVLFDPLNSGSSVGEVFGGQFVAAGWQALTNADCIRYEIPQIDQGQLEFQTTNVSSPNPAAGKRMLISMWDPDKGDYRDNPFRMHLQKMDKNTVNRWDVRLRWISRGQETNEGISFFDFEPQIVYNWRIRWGGDFPGISSQHVKVFLDGLEILRRHYDRPYRLKKHWVELGQCQREETLEQAIWSNIRITKR